MEQLGLQLTRSRGILDPHALDLGGRWHLVRGDCAEVMAKIPDQCVDLIFADPPYGLSGGGTTCSGGARVGVDKGAWDAPMTPAESLLFHERWLEQARHVLKPTGTIWISGTHHVIFDVGFALRRLGFHVLNLVTWCKSNAAPHLAGRYLTHSTEQLIWASPKKLEPLAHVFNYQELKRDNGGKQLRDFWIIPVTFAPHEKQQGKHPTQKPEALLERIVRASSAPGALVLDPFNGGGTTGAVSIRLGRRYIGIDLDPHYLDSTARRLEQVQRSMTA